MKTNTATNSRARNIALILATSILASTAVLSAEPTTEAQLPIRAERRSAKVVGHTSSGIPIEQYELTYHVTFTDLDLTTSVGAKSLQARVFKAAYSLCKDLDKLYPVS